MSKFIRCFGKSLKYLSFAVGECFTKSKSDSIVQASKNGDVWKTLTLSSSSKQEPSKLKRGQKKLEKMQKNDPSWWATSPWRKENPESGDTKSCSLSTQSSRRYANGDRKSSFILIIYWLILSSVECWNSGLKERSVERRKKRTNRVGRLTTNWWKMKDYSKNTWRWVSIKIHPTIRCSRLRPITVLPRSCLHSASRVLCRKKSISHLMTHWSLVDKRQSIKGLKEIPLTSLTRPFKEFCQA